MGSLKDCLNCLTKFDGEKCPRCNPDPGEITYVGDGEESVRCNCIYGDHSAVHLDWCKSLGQGAKGKPPESNERESFKHVASLPEGEQCVGMVVFMDRVIVACTNGLFFLNDEDKLESFKFKEDAFKHMESCSHGKALTDYCEPCGRVNGGP